jgi:hypothetical protein
MDSIVIKEVYGFRYYLKLNRTGANILYSYNFYWNGLVDNVTTMHHWEAEKFIAKMRHQLNVRYLIEKTNKKNATYINN